MLYVINNLYDKCVPPLLFYIECMWKRCVGLLIAFNDSLNQGLISCLIY